MVLVLDPRTIVLGKTYFKDGGKEFSLKIDGLDFTGSDGKKTDTISMAVDQNNTIEDVVATINAKFQEQGKTGWILLTLR